MVSAVGLNAIALAERFGYTAFKNMWWVIEIFQMLARSLGHQRTEDLKQYSSHLRRHNWQWHIKSQPPAPEFISSALRRCRFYRFLSSCHPASSWIHVLICIRLVWMRIYFILRPNNDTSLALFFSFNFHNTNIEWFRCEFAPIPSITSSTWNYHKSDTSNSWPSNHLKSQNSQLFVQ